MSDIRLFDYWRSSASYRVRIALNLAGLDYETVPVDLLDRAHKSPEHLERNPQGLVPVLDIDGQRLTQSLAMVEYIDETRKAGFLPADPAERARVRALAYAVAVDVHPVCNLGVVAHVAKLAPGDTVREDWMRHFIAPGLAAFEKLLAGFPPARFCAGDAPGLADICLIPQLYNAHRWGVSLDDFPRIRAVEAACAEHPAFDAAKPTKPE